MGQSLDKCCSKPGNEDSTFRTDSFYVKPSNDHSLEKKRNMHDGESFIHLPGRLHDQKIYEVSEEYESSAEN